jgi:hypothetical protein
MPRLAGRREGARRRFTQRLLPIERLDLIWEQTFKRQFFRELNDLRWPILDD